MKTKQAFLIISEYGGSASETYDTTFRLASTEEKAFAIKDEMVADMKHNLMEDMEEEFNSPYNNRIENEYRWLLFDEDYCYGGEVRIEVLDLE